MGTKRKMKGKPEPTFKCQFCRKKHPIVQAHGVATQDGKLIDVCDNCFEKPPTARRIVRSKGELRHLSDWMLVEDDYQEKKKRLARWRRKQLTDSRAKARQRRYEELMGKGS